MHVISHNPFILANENQYQLKGANHNRCLMQIWPSDISHAL